MARRSVSIELLSLFTLMRSRKAGGGDRRLNIVAFLHALEERDTSMTLATPYRSPRPAHDLQV